MILDELTYNEREQFSSLLACWLVNWTDECKEKVMAQADKIYHDEALMKLLAHYKTAKTNEMKNLCWDLEMRLENGRTIQTFNSSSTYSQVLYDLLIK